MKYDLLYNELKFIQELRTLEKKYKLHAKNIRDYNDDLCSATEKYSKEYKGKEVIVKTVGGVIREGIIESFSHFSPVGPAFMVKYSDGDIDSVFLNKIKFK